MVGTLRSAIQYSLEHETVMARVRSAGIRNVAAFDQWAESLQRVSGVSSDIIVTQAAITKSLGASEAQAKLFTEASLELAAALGRDLVSVQNQLNKTLGGTLGELAELVPAMKSLNAEQLRAGEAAKYILENFGGSVDAQAETIVGSANIVRRAFEDLLQTLGDGFTGQGAGVGAAESLHDMASGIDGITDALKEFQGVEGELAMFERLMAGMTGGTAERGFGYNLPNAVRQNARALQGRYNEAYLIGQSSYFNGASMFPDVALGGGSRLDPIPVEVVKVSVGTRPGVTDAESELDFLRRWGIGGEMPPARGFIPDPGLPPAGSPFEQPRSTANDWLEEEARQREYIRDLTEQSMNTLTQSLLDSIFYARDLSDVFKNLLRDIAGSLVQTGVKSFVASIIPGAGVAMAGGGSYSIGPSDNNPALQQQARELSRQMNKSRRRGF